MTAHPSATLKPQAPLCGACRHENATNSRYCAGCGHALFEPCAECTCPVTLTQKFCGACGFDLAQSLQQRREKKQQRLTSAIRLAKEHDYDQSIGLLKELSSSDDFRFKDLSRRASDTLAKVQRLRQKTLAMSQQMMEQAKAAIQQEDRQTALACLQKVPPPFLDAESHEILSDSQSHLQRRSTLKSKLQESVEEKNWPAAGMLIDELLDIDPHNARYQQLAEQVAGKLVARAEKCLRRREYLGALDALNAIPADYRTDQHQLARRKIETVQWLADQFQGEAFATATLRRLAARYAKEVPRDRSATALVQELSALMKNSPENPRAAFAPWRAPASCWLGGQVNMFATPRAIGTSGDPQLRQLPGRFCVAMGLALQGLDSGRIKEQFVPKKNMLFSSISPWRKTSCWGIDVGSSAIHAVLLRRDKRDAKPVVVRTYAAEFEMPTCRHGKADNAPETIRRALEKMKAEVEFGDAPVFVNLPARELISRFLRLPPLKDKQLEDVLADELDRQLPVSPDQLEVVRWVGELGSDPEQGRHVVVSAAKKRAVAERLQLFTDAGLKISGMQADPLALVNFIDQEFSDLLGAQAAGDSAADSAPSIAVVDAGASKTAVVIVSAEACWFWAVESGSEDLTSLLARSTKRVAAEAEKLKRDPATLQRPAETFAPLETKQEELRARLEKVAAEAHRKHGRFDVTETWCVGGAPLTHGWLRRVMLSR